MPKSSKRRVRFHEDTKESGEESQLAKLNDVIKDMESKLAEYELKAALFAAGKRACGPRTLRHTYAAEIEQKKVEREALIARISEGVTHSPSLAHADPSPPPNPFASERNGGKPLVSTATRDRSSTPCGEKEKAAVEAPPDLQQGYPPSSAAPADVGSVPAAAPEATTNRQTPEDPTDIPTLIATTATHEAVQASSTDPPISCAPLSPISTLSPANDQPLPLITATSVNTTTPLVNPSLLPAPETTPCPLSLVPGTEDLIDDPNTPKKLPTAQPNEPSPNLSVSGLPKLPPSAEVASHAVIFPLGDSLLHHKAALAQSSNSLPKQALTSELKEPDDWGRPLKLQGFPKPAYKPASPDQPNQPQPLPPHMAAELTVASEVASNLLAIDPGLLPPQSHSQSQDDDIRPDAVPPASPTEPLSTHEAPKHELEEPPLFDPDDDGLFTIEDDDLTDPNLLVVTNHIAPGVEVRSARAGPPTKELREECRLLGEKFKRDVQAIALKSNFKDRMVLKMTGIYAFEQRKRNICNWASSKWHSENPRLEGEKEKERQARYLAWYGAQLRLPEAEREIWEEEVTAWFLASRRQIWTDRKDAGETWKNMAEAVKEISARITNWSLFGGFEIVGFMIPNDLSDGLATASMQLFGSEEMLEKFWNRKNTNVKSFMSQLVVDVISAKNAKVKVPTVDPAKGVDMAEIEKIIASDKKVAKGSVSLYFKTLWNNFIADKKLPSSAELKQFSWQNIPGKLATARLKLKGWPKGVPFPGQVKKTPEDMTVVSTWGLVTYDQATALLRVVARSLNPNTEENKRIRLEVWNELEIKIAEDPVAGKEIPIIYEAYEAVAPGVDGDTAQQQIKVLARVELVDRIGRIKLQNSKAASEKRAHLTDLDDEAEGDNPDPAAPDSLPDAVPNKQTKGKPQKRKKGGKHSDKLAGAGMAQASTSEARRRPTFVGIKSTPVISQRNTEQKSNKRQRVAHDYIPVDTSDEEVDKDSEMAVDPVDQHLASDSTTLRPAVEVEAVLSPHMFAATSTSVLKRKYDESGIHASAESDGPAAITQPSTHVDGHVSAGPVTSPSPPLALVDLSALTTAHGPDNALGGGFPPDDFDAQSWPAANNQALVVVPEPVAGKQIHAGAAQGNWTPGQGSFHEPGLQGNYGIGTHLSRYDVDAATSLAAAHQAAAAGPFSFPSTTNTGHAGFPYHTFSTYGEPHVLDPRHRPFPVPSMTTYPPLNTHLHAHGGANSAFSAPFPQMQGLGHSSSGSGLAYSIPAQQVYPPQMHNAYQPLTQPQPTRNKRFRQIISDAGEVIFEEI